MDLTRRMELLHDSELLDGDGEFLASRFEGKRRMEGKGRKDISKIFIGSITMISRMEWNGIIPVMRSVAILFVLFDM